MPRLGTYFDSNDSGFLKEDGAMTSGSRTRGKGRTIGEIADGVSKTVLVAESKEETLQLAVRRSDGMGHRHRDRTRSMVGRQRC